MHGEALYLNRRDAGVRLGKILERDYKDKLVLVLGIPRGGVEIACAVARILQAELSVVITKKLPHPFHKGSAIGAVAEDGSVFMPVDAYASWDPVMIKNIVQQQLNEIQQRIQRFRRGRLLPDMRGRTVIIVDDGIATGSTIVPAIKLCRAAKAAEVIVAVPVSGRTYVSAVNALADKVIISAQPEGFTTVGEAYRDFTHPQDTEVIKLLDDFSRLHKRVSH